MDKETLSKIYYTSTTRVMDVMEKLYEDLHGPTGTPKHHEDEIRKMITDTIKEVRSELDYIKTAVSEINEYYSR